MSCYKQDSKLERGGGRLDYALVTIHDVVPKSIRSDR